MGLLDDLSDAKSFGKAQSLFCSVCTLLAQLPKEESTLLARHMKDSKIGHIALSRILKKNGYEISDGVIGRHRRGLCKGVAK